MNIQHLTKHFEKIGAKLEVNIFKERTGNWNTGTTEYSIDVLEEKNNERYLLNINEDLVNELIFQPVDVRVKDRHLLLFVNNPKPTKANLVKQKFLCGHDERHWFVAGIENEKGITNVSKAMESLKPEMAQAAQKSFKVKKKNRNKRHNKGFKRQGEWFFIPAPNLKVWNGFPTLIFKNEPLRRGAGKPHYVDEIYRTGGELVYVNQKFPNGLTENNYKKYLRKNPKAKFSNWQIMRRNAKVYARGKVRHKDHATISLVGWHEVNMNKEFLVESVAFLD